MINKSQIFFAALFILVIAAAACQKPYAPEPVIPTSPAAPDSIYIHKIYSLLEENGRYDTAEVSTFYYDNFKRVIRVNVYEPPLQGRPAYNSDFRYYYTGADTLPYKKVYTYHAADSATYFFSYDNQKRLIRDSSINTRSSTLPYDSYVTTNYQYSPGKLTAIERSGLFSDPQVFSLSYDTAMLTPDGDIQSHVSWFENEITTKSVFTYGNSAGPYAGSTIVQAHQELPFGETFTSERMTKKNVLTQHEESGNNLGLVHDWVYAYDYNALGLVTRLKHADKQSPSFYYWIDVFTYTSL